MNLQKICLILFITSIAITTTPGLFLTDAQSWVDSVVVSPENPTEVDEVTLKVYGSFPSACCYFYVSGDYLISGNQITINLYTFYDSTIICLPVITPYSDEFDIGQLMSAEYTVYITEYLNASEHDYLTHGFSVTTDSDSDGVADDADNCPDTTNGPGGGTCSEGTEEGASCMSHGDCGCEGYCSMDQEDVDEDGIGDVCDNCPNTPNGPEGGTCSEGTIGDPCMSHGDCSCEGYCSMNQEDADEDDVGDVCDSTPIP